MENQRTTKLIEKLCEEKTVKVKDLAIALQVSEKTIRNDLKQLQIVLKNHGACLDILQGKGIELTIGDELKFQKYFAELSRCQMIEDNRMLQLFQILLESERFLKLDDLSEKLYLSRARLSSTLKVIKKILHNYSLDIQVKPSYGIKITGEEFNLRKCICDYQLDLLKNNKKIDEVSLIQKLLLQLFQEHQYKINDIAFVNLVAHIQIMLRRIRHNHLIELNETTDLYNKTEYQIAKQFAQCIHNEIALLLPIGEIEYITLHLISKKKIEYERLDETNILSENTSRLIDDALYRIYQKFDIDLRMDFDLHVALSLHILPLISRIRYNMKMKNPMLFEIKANYPLCYDLAIEMGHLFYEEFNVYLHEEEIGYLALHFNLAIERKKMNLSKKKILIICSHGGCISQLLALKIKQNFESCIAKIDTADMFTYQTFNLDEYDYLITTVPLDNLKDKPIIHISYFLNKNDIELIQQTLDQGHLSLKIAIKEDLFFTQIRGKNREEILKEIIVSIPSHYEIPEMFYEKIMEREALYSTEIGNFVAIPHPMECEVKHTVFSITVLDRAILWHEKYVQVICLIAIEESRKKDLQPFYENFVQLVSNENKMIRLIQSPTFETLVSLI